MGDSTTTVSQNQRPKIKHDWYQTETHVVITVLVKNVQEEQLKVNYSDRTLSLSIKLPDTENEYSLELDLAHEIVPDHCNYRIYSTKIEIKLKKKEGIRWTNLEGDPHVVVAKPIPKEILNASTTTTNSASVPKYPSSYKKAVDWNAVEKQIKEEEKMENPEGEEALNKMFQEIYGKGSDEVKKAMNKSFLESGGTVLSTNWGDVGNKKVDVKPPDGMEFKKWQN